MALTSRLLLVLLVHWHIYPQLNASSSSLIGSSRVGRRRQQRLFHTHRSTIVGGSPAATNEYRAYGIYSGDFDSGRFCGGVLIHADIFLTAAHCFLGVASSSAILGLHIYFGANRIDRSDADEVRTVVDFRQHPEYQSIDGVGEYNDYMILLLDSPVTSTSPLQYDTTTTMAGDDSDTLDREMTILGFGLTSDGGESSSILLEATVMRVDFSECDEDYLDDLEPEQHICATAPGVDACQNDSGGPLLDHTGHVVLGIVSFGETCGSPLTAGVYARVSGAQDFVRGAICDLSAVPPSPRECRSQAVAATPRGCCWMLSIVLLLLFFLGVM